MSGVDNNNLILNESEINMPKPPIMLFNPKDWIADLQGHPLDIAGAWIRICCQLAIDHPRGESEKTLGEWAGILGVGTARSRKLLFYIFEKNIAKISKKNAKISKKNDIFLVNQILTKKKTILFISHQKEF